MSHSMTTQGGATAMEVALIVVVVILMAPVELALSLVGRHKRPAGF